MRHMYCRIALSVGTVTEDLPELIRVENAIGVAGGVIFANVAVDHPHSYMKAAD